jgi:hypothetical protein
MGTHTDQQMSFGVCSATPSRLRAHHDAQGYPLCTPSKKIRTEDLDIADRAEQGVQARGQRRSSIPRSEPGVKPGQQIVDISADQATVFVGASPSISTLDSLTLEAVCLYAASLLIR